MKRDGLYAPTLEDAIEISGIETLHPGGAALTRRSAEIAGLVQGTEVLDVSCGRGTQSLLYAEEYGAVVTGLDLAPDMLETARARAAGSSASSRLSFLRGDSQELPLPAERFDVVINECAVGIPEDSQRVLDEMARVTKPGGLVLIHESVWAAPMSGEARYELTERYGTTPLEPGQWRAMLEAAGLVGVQQELEPWSRPENFWKVRQERDVPGPGQVLSWPERLRTIWRIVMRWGVQGALTALENEKRFYAAIQAGQLGYGLFWGRKPA